MTPPTPSLIRATREGLGLAQPDAARLIRRTLRQWQRYEAGTSKLDPILWQAWRVKAARIAKRNQEHTP